MSRVVIDPGHGGKDPGAVGLNGVHEADINLSVALLVAEILAPVVEVTMIRTDDSTVELEDRAPIANRIDAEAYVSIHCNAATSPSAHGTETFSYPGAPNGKLLATAIHGRVMPALGLTDRGLKEENFCVLRETEMAAALVELAFISNPSEERLLADPAVQRKAAIAIAEGIAEYLGVQIIPSGPRIVFAGQVLEARIIDGRTYVPVRALAEALGRTVEWVEAEQTVYIR